MVRRLFLAFCLLFSGLSFAQSATKEFSLDNGLKLIVREDHRAPVVVTQLWYKVGSSYEYNGITGISHMLEHMMFKGTEKHPDGELVNLITEEGGKQNAFTAHDFTAYYQEMPVDKLELSFQLESDRMKNLVFHEKEFTSEKKVVAEERRLRTENKPEGKFLERFLAVANVGSPYQRPVIGWMHDIQNYTLDDAKNWYKTYYSPNNAILVVVGDVNPDAVYELAKKYFNDIEPSNLPPLKIYKSFSDIGERRLKFEAMVKVPQLFIGFNVPSINTADNEWEPYALEVLSNILSGGMAARFEKDLVRDQKVAAEAGSSYWDNKLHDSIFIIHGIPQKDVNLNELESAFLQETAKLQEDLVSDEELERVKINVIASNIYQKDSMLYQAYEIGSLEALGKSWRLGEEFVNKINSITKEQIQEVVKKYLKPNNMTVAYMIPKENDEH